VAATEGTDSRPPPDHLAPRSPCAWTRAPGVSVNGRHRPGKHGQMSVFMGHSWVLPEWRRRGGNPVNTSSWPDPALALLALASHVQCLTWCQALARSCVARLDRSTFISVNTSDVSGRADRRAWDPRGPRTYWPSRVAALPTVAVSARSPDDRTGRITVPDQSHADQLSSAWRPGRWNTNGSAMSSACWTYGATSAAHKPQELNRNDITTRNSRRKEPCPHKE
jgi:hypothetical protein